MCASSVPKRDSLVYKRRKLQRNTVALLSEENATESTKESASYHSSITSEDHPLRVQKDGLDRNTTILVSSGDTHDDGNLSICEQSNLQDPSPNTVPGKRSSIQDDKVPVESSISCLQKSSPEHNAGTIDRYSSSKSIIGHGSDLIKTEMEDPSECSSSDNVGAELFWEFTSAKELCISVLKHHGLLGGVRDTSACASLEVLGNDDAMPSQPCKICGHLENPLKMLICDNCEEAFHVSCCNPRVRKLPVDEWYCQPCFKKRPKSVLDHKSGKTIKIMGEMSGHRKTMSHGDLNPISFMLSDSEPYTSGVRIGKDFQAEVPEWSGPIFGDCDSYWEPLEVDPAEYFSLDGWNFYKPSKSTSIGNWVQCREVIYTSENDDGTICGKWRSFGPAFRLQPQSCLKWLSCQLTVRSGYRGLQIKVWVSVQTQVNSLYFLALFSFFILKYRMVFFYLTLLFIFLLFFFVSLFSFFKGKHIILNLTGWRYM
ncbi:uncharacterized protein LOC103713145 isoform X3 [Phoenix dactylifera]|nr:uncharacterized protein LOC103713145 isoform X3 [Phoenix dactylifera]